MTLLKQSLDYTYPMPVSVLREWDGQTEFNNNLSLGKVCGTEICVEWKKKNQKLKQKYSFNQIYNFV